MDLTDILSVDRVSVLPSMDKADALNALITQLSETPQVRDPEALARALGGLGEDVCHCSTLET